MALSKREHNKKFNELDKGLYQAMKVATKKRKIKLSAEGDLYKKIDPYFYRAWFYLEWIPEFPTDRVDIKMDISVKYHRFDELQYNIVNPANPVHFTDKIRANSGAMFYRPFPRIVQSFPFGGTDEALSQLCEDILDFIEQYYQDFFQMVEREYGDLNGYYIAEKDKNPLSAGLAYLDKGDYQNAAVCFSKIERSSSSWRVLIETDEQYRRAETSGSKIICVDNGDGTVRKVIFRDRASQFVDYAVALQNGFEWTNDRAMYGLLPEEREQNNSLCP